MSDFAINGVINVHTNADQALAKLQRLEAELKTARGRKVHKLFDADDIDRVSKHVDGRTFRELGKDIRRTEIASRLAANGIKDFDGSLVNALHSAEKFNRVSQNMLDNFRAGNFGDPKDLNYYRELARTSKGLDEMRQAAAAAEITGGQIPASLRQAVKEADDFQRSYGRMARTVDDFKFANAQHGLDNLTQAMNRYSRAEALAANALQKSENVGLDSGTRSQALKDFDRYTSDMLKAQNDFDRESARLDTQRGVRQQKAHSDEMTRRRENAKLNLMVDADEKKAYDRRVNDAIRATSALETARARDLNSLRSTIEGRYAALDAAEAKHEQDVARQMRDLGYAQMAETSDQEAVSRRRLADATRDVTRAQTALNTARESGNVDAHTRAINNHRVALDRQIQAQSSLSRAVQFNNGLASQNRYAMYDAAQTYGMLAAIPAASIIGLGAAAGWWESSMTNIARTSGIDTFSSDGRVEMERLEGQLIRMSDVIPTWVGNMTDIARVGGQLGVEAKNIADFTSVVSQFTAVSDVTDIDQVAESFGRIQALTGEGDFRVIADAVTKVGVNAAATDAQILKTSQELAQAGAGANFSTQQLIGMAGGFASLGVPAERARSVMQDFVRIATGGLTGANDSMSKFAGHMGLTTEEAQRLFRTNPAKFITDFAKGLSSLSPEEVVTALQEIGLRGQRASPVFQALAKDARNAGEGMGVFASAINDAVSSEGALMEQFAPKLDDLAATWQRFLNVFSTTSAVTGGSVAPFLDDILSSVTDLMRGWRDFAATDMGGFLINAATAAGIAATAFFGLRAAVAAAAGAGLALQAISKASGGTFRGQMAMAASAIMPVGVAERIKGVQKGAAGGVTLIPAGTAEAVTRVGTAAGTAAPQITRLERAAFAVRAAMDDPRGTMRAFQTGVRGVASTAVTAARTLGSSAMALAGGPLGASALVTGGAYLGVEALGDAGSKATTELTTLIATGKSASEVFSSAMFQDDWSKTWFGDLSEYDLNEVLPKTTTNPFESFFGNTMGENAVLRRLTGVAQAYGQIASIDMDQARQGLSDLASAEGLTADAMYSLIDSDSALKESLLASAAAAGVNIDSLDTLAGQRQLAAYATNALADANGNLSVSENTLGELYSESEAALQAQLSTRMESLTALNATTSALGGYYSAMDGVGDVVAAFSEKYGDTVDLWDESRGIWNITNSDTAALALTFEDLAAKTLEAASAFETVEESNAYIQAARDSISGYLADLGVEAATIESILSGLGLDLTEFTFKVTTEGVESTITGVQALAGHVLSLPRGTTITVDALTDEAIAQLAEAGLYAHELADGTYEIVVSMRMEDLGSEGIGYLTDAIDSLNPGEFIHFTDPSQALMDSLAAQGYEFEVQADGSLVIHWQVINEGLPNNPIEPPRDVVWEIPVVLDWRPGKLHSGIFDIMGLQQGVTVPIEYVTDFANIEGELAVIAGHFNGVTGSVTISSDIVEALNTIDGLSLYVNDITGEIMVVADTQEAADELQEFLDRAAAANPEVRFSPDMDAVREAIEEVTKGRDVEVEGIPQMSAADRAITRTSRPRPMTITANANVSAAETLLNQTARNRPTIISVSVSGGAEADRILNRIARNRTSTITVNVNTNHNTHYTSSGSSGPPSGGQRPIVTGPNNADGGYTGAGPKWAFAGNVHAGEYVIPKRDVDQATGLPRADALARLMGQAGAMGGPQVIVQQGSGGGIMELGPTSIHAIARAVQPMLKMDSNVIAQGVSSQFANNTRKGAY